MGEPRSGADMKDGFSDPEGLSDRLEKEIAETMWPPASDTAEAAVSYDRRAQTGTVPCFLEAKRAFQARVTSRESSECCGCEKSVLAAPSIRCVSFVVVTFDRKRDGLGVQPGDHDTVSHRPSGEHWRMPVRSAVLTV